ncbi:MAG: alpha/beta fold hydrolase [Anaerolineae bacterium]|nr:alpha/beta fold hydrolase [Anaerolineae bacterium]
MKKYLSIVLLTFTLLLTLSLSAQAQTGQENIYEIASCPFDVPEGGVEGKNLICGYATVPEQHAWPDGPTLRLPVVIFPSTAANPAPDPLVLNAGGPGESNIDSFVEAMAGEIGQPILAQRDVVIIEIRGTRYAEPNLLCPETADFQLAALHKNLSDAEATKLQLEAIQACHDRLVNDEVNLAAYNSLESANDIALVTAALGYGQFNLYGNSAGTLLAQHVMRDYSDRLRSVIIGSVLPLAMPDVSFMPATASETLYKLLARCQEDRNCAAAFPNLEKELWQTFDQLNTNPVTITLQNPTSREPYDFLLTGDRLAQWLFAIMYDTHLPGQLPFMLHRIIEGDYSLIENVPGFFLPDSSFSLGFQYSIFCSEDAAYNPEDIAAVGPYPSFQYAAAAMWFGPKILPLACQIWDVPTLDNYVDEPVRTTVPTLLLSGEFDHVTPPPFADRVAENLENAYAYTFPGVAHSPIDAGECPHTILLDFLNNPTTAPHADCIDEMSLRFVTESIAARLTAPEPPWIHLLLLLTSVLLMVVALVVWGIAALRQRGQQPSSPGVQNTRWAAGIAIGLNLVFLTIFFASNPLEIIYGFPPLLWAVQWLPLISILPTIAALYYVGRAWVEDYWSLAEKIFYTLVVAALVVFIWELWWWYLLL